MDNKCITCGAEFSAPLQCPECIQGKKEADANAYEGHLEKTHLTLLEVAAEARMCADSWAHDALLMGNCSAGDLSKIFDRYIALELENRK